MSARLPDLVQTDFSGGQINYALKRRDNLEFVKTGGRQMKNWRIEAGGTLLQRPGRRPVFPTAGGRNEYVRMQASAEFILSFGVGVDPLSYDPNATWGLIKIFNLDGTAAVSFSSPDCLWTADTLDQISWCVALFDIVICYPGMQPQIMRWSPADQTWTFLPYSFRVINSQVQEPFYRFSVPGARMTYSGFTGNVTLTCDRPYFRPGMIGMRLSIVGQQVTITNVIDSQNAQVQVAYRLPDCVVIAVLDTRPFEDGMIVELRDQNLKFEFHDFWQTPYAIGGTYFVVLNMARGVMLSDLVCDFNQFTYDSTNPDVLISPIGSAQVYGYPFAFGAGQPTVEWTEEFMCPYRGWPSRCAYTEGRLAFFGFPQMQEAILWSAVGADDVCWVDPVAATNQPEAGANPDSAILEFEASRPKIILAARVGRHLRVHRPRHLHDPGRDQRDPALARQCRLSPLQ